jgi:hypothetical protein
MWLFLRGQREEKGEKGEERCILERREGRKQKKYSLIIYCEPIPQLHVHWTELAPYPFREESKLEEKQEGNENDYVDTSGIVIVGSYYCSNCGGTEPLDAGVPLSTLTTLFLIALG